MHSCLSQAQSLHWTRTSCIVRCLLRQRDRWGIQHPGMPEAASIHHAAIQASWRQTVAGALNVINFGLRNPKALKPVNFAAKQLLKLQIKDPVLRKNVTPNFDIGCKRILFANNTLFR